MPMADGALFLPVKSDIRKIIHKGEGDIIQVTLYLDESDFEIPEDFADCLRQEPAVLDKFLKYPEGEKKVFIEWISAAKTDLTKANRMIRAMNLISHGKRLLEKNSKEK